MLADGGGGCCWVVVNAAGCCRRGCCAAINPSMLVLGCVLLLCAHASQSARGSLHMKATCTLHGRPLLMPLPAPPCPAPPCPASPPAFLPACSWRGPPQHAGDRVCSQDWAQRRAPVLQASTSTHPAADRHRRPPSLLARLRAALTASFTQATRAFLSALACLLLAPYCPLHMLTRAPFAPAPRTAALPCLQVRDLR